MWRPNVLRLADGGCRKTAMPPSNVRVAQHGAMQTLWPDLAVVAGPPMLANWDDLQGLRLDALADAPPSRPPDAPRRRLAGWVNGGGGVGCHVHQGMNATLVGGARTIRAVARDCRSPRCWPIGICRTAHHLVQCWRRAPWRCRLWACSASVALAPLGDDLSPVHWFTRILPVGTAISLRPSHPFVLRPLRVPPPALPPLAALHARWP